VASRKQDKQQKNFKKYFHEKSQKSQKLQTQVGRFGYILDVARRVRRHGLILRQMPFDF
jgi:hypothetical protein